MKNFKEYLEEDKRTDTYVTDEIKRRKLARIIVNATDDRKMLKGKPAFTMPHHTGSSTIHVYLRKMPGPTKGVVAYNYEMKFDEKMKEDKDNPCWPGFKQVGMKKKDGKMVPNCVPVDEAVSAAQQAAIAISKKKSRKYDKDGNRIEENEDEKKKKVAQDKDVKDRKGTQPAKYYKGDMKKSTKQDRARHFEKGAKMDDDNPAAYKPAPGDKSAKTKLSKHTKKYRQMFGEKIEGLAKKSKKSGVSYGILKKVYDRGMAAWRTGHRPGTTPQQWAFARVNSFLTGGGARKADADLWKKAKK